MYQQKYIKYKTKYIDLKNQIAGRRNIKTNDNTELTPTISTSNKLLKFDFPEISIASVHYPEGPTGCTYVHFDVESVYYYCDARGGAVMTYASDETRTNRKFIRGICFAGGSFLGLEAISGCVVQEMINVGYAKMKRYNVTGATLRSGNLHHNKIYPDKELGRFAVNSLKKNELYLGQVGAGTMAGNGYYGLGAAFHVHKGIKIFVVTAVNALGVLYDEKGNIVRDQWRMARDEKKEKDPESENTTLTAIITDLSLNHLEIRQLSVQCHTNMAVVIRPFHTIGDGDVLFGVTLNRIDRNSIEDFSLEEFFKVCSNITNQAILTCYE